MFIVIKQLFSFEQIFIEWLSQSLWKFTCFFIDITFFLCFLLLIVKSSEFYNSMDSRGEWVPLESLKIPWRVVRSPWSPGVPKSAVSPLHVRPLLCLAHNFSRVNKKASNLRFIGFYSQAFVSDNKKNRSKMREYDHARWPRGSSLNSGSLLFNIIVKYSVFVIVFGL